MTSRWVAPIDAHHLQQFRIGGRNAAGTSPPALATAAANAADGHQFRRADDASVRAQGDGLGNVPRRADSAAGDHRDLVANPLGLEELVDPADGILDRHGDVLLGDVRRRPRAAVAAVEVYDVCARVVHADGHHVDVAWSGDLGREQRPRIDVRHPVEMFLMVFDRIDAVEREGRKERHADDRFAEGRHAGRVLVAQQVAAQAGLRPLGILELDDPRPLDRLLADAEQARWLPA